MNCGSVHELLLSRTIAFVFVHVTSHGLLFRPVVDTFHFVDTFSAREHTFTSFDDRVGIDRAVDAFA